MSTWGDVAESIAKAAPILGNLLPGVGTVAGLGVGAVASVVASALGVSPDPDSIMSALKNDPDALAKVRMAELDNQKQFAQIAMQRELGVLQAQTTQYTAEASDRDSARKFAAQQPHDWLRPAITLILLLGAFGITYMILSGLALSVITDTTAALTVGVLLRDWFTWVTSALGFLFGTPRDSSDVAGQTSTALQKLADTRKPPALTSNTATIEMPTNANLTATVSPADTTYKGH